jgi:hypothetical protein
MYGSAYYFKMSDMHDVAKEMGQLAKDLPNFVEMTMFILAAKNGQLTEEYTEDKGWIFKVTAVAFGDTDKESLDALEKMDSSPAIKRALKREAKGPVTFKALFDGADVAWPSGLRSKVENLSFNVPPEEVLDVIHKDWMDTPSWRSAVTLVISTGKKNFLHSSPDVALSMDGCSYGGYWVMWKDASDDAANLAWTKTAIANLHKVCTKPYIGEVEYVDDNSLVKAAYDPNKWTKLQEIRAKYDPEGVFQGWLGGIPPSA